MKSKGIKHSYFLHRKKNEKSK